MAANGEKEAPPAKPGHANPSGKSNFSVRLPKISQLQDRFGNTFYFGNTGDYWHPPLPIGSDTDYRTHVRQIRDMEIRDDDVIIYSFPKTGLHWHTEIVNQLKRKSAELNPEGENLLFLDTFSMKVLNAAPSPRQLVTHVPFRYFPKQALKKKVKILYLIRNPKDVLVSYYNHLHNMDRQLNYPGTFEQFFQLYFECGYYYGDIFDFMMDVQEGLKEHPDTPVFTSVFEDMKKDPIGGVVKLNAFLGTGCDAQLCEDIALSCSFKKLKAFKDATMPEQLKALFRKGASAGFYRKGEIGDWKNWFTVSMNEFYEEEYKKRMANFDVQFTYT